MSSMAVITETTRPNSVGQSLPALDCTCGWEHTFWQARLQDREEHYMDVRMTKAEHRLDHLEGRVIPSPRVEVP